GTPGRGGGGVPASQFQPAPGGGPAAVLLVGASAGDDERLDEGEFRQLVLAQSGVERGGGAPVAAVLLHPPVGGGARPAAEETHGRHELRWSGGGHGVGSVVVSVQVGDCRGRGRPARLPASPRVPGTAVHLVLGDGDQRY